MSTITVQLNGYRVKPGNIKLGTYDSYGLETLQLVPDELWEKLAIVATFNAPSGSHTRVKADADLCVKVPPEAIEDESGDGTIVFVGTADGKRRISQNLTYTVFDHDTADGDDSAAPPTPDLVQQILAASNTAEKTANSVREDADAGKFKGEQGPPGPKGDTPDILNNMDIQEILNMLD